MRIIPRRIEIKKIKQSFPWVLIYGRRKTGKSFLVENFLRFDKFFFVNRDTSVFDKRTRQNLTYQEFLKLFDELIETKTIVVDEFHRLPSSFLDHLHAIGIKGNLILITSTLHLMKEMLSKPLLGIFRPVRVDLVDEREILLFLSKELKGTELVEASTYLREVMLVPSFKPPTRRFLTDYLNTSNIFLKELIGEIFVEEERELTKVYEGIMKVVADGKNVSTEISDALFSLGILSKNNPGVLQKYLSNLVEMGILQKIKVWNKKKYRYFHRSPLLDLHFYLEGKYSYTEVETPRKFIRDVVDIKVPQHVEHFIRSFLAKAFGLQPQLIQKRNLEIDVALFKFKKLKIVAEVKWKKRISKGELRDVEKKLETISYSKKFLIVPEKKEIEYKPFGIKILDVNDLIKLSKQTFNR